MPFSFMPSTRPLAMKVSLKCQQLDHTVLTSRMFPFMNATENEREIRMQRERIFRFCKKVLSLPERKLPIVSVFTKELLFNPWQQFVILAEDLETLGHKLVIGLPFLCQTSCLTAGVLHKACYPLQ